MISESLPYTYAIVLLSYNHPDLTERCINSVLSFKFPKHQFFLIHNGSETKNRQRLQDLFPEILHISIPQNRGFAAGSNWGLNKAFQSFDFVFFLTNDTEVLKLPLQIPPQYQFISPTILKRNTSSIDSVAGIVNTRFGTLKHLKVHSQSHFDSDLNNHPSDNTFTNQGYNELNSIYKLKKFEYFYIPGTAFIIHKNIFHQMNGFDENYHTYWEDVDFSFRLNRNDIKMYSSELFCLKHKIGKTCHKNRFYTLYLYQRNRKKFMKKHRLLNFYFIFNYSKDILNIFLKLLFKDNRKQNLKFLWKAIYE